MLRSTALDGRTVAALVTNVPGPLCAASLAAMGARVVKIEPPAGDPLAAAAPAWYDELTGGLAVRRLDLSGESARDELEALLRGADILLTAMRAPALLRMHLDWAALHARFRRLCHVALVGEAAPYDGRAGHDLTYQARAGLVDPPGMPRTLLADLFAAERATTAALAALLEADRTHAGVRYEVAIADGARALGEPLRQGLTAPGGPLGGGYDAYGIYACADGWVAVAALEPHFAQRLREALGVRDLDRVTLSDAFARRTRAQCEELAAHADLPLAAVNAT